MGHQISARNVDNMRLLAFSDLHDEEVTLEKIKEFYLSAKFDYVLIAGDTTSHSVSFVEEVVWLFSNCFIIPGNNEDTRVIEYLKNKEPYIHEKKVTVGDYTIVGFGLSNMTPFNTPGELSEEEIYERIKQLPINNKTILLCHCPPFGHFDTVRDKKTGSTSLLRIIHEKEPLVFLCGHIHELEGVARIGKTTVIKIPAAMNGKVAVVAIEDKDIKVDFVTV